MKRILFAAALLLAAAPVHAAGLWNGTTSDLSATVSATAHSYPTILAAWVKFSSVDDDAVISLSDGDAAGSNDSLQLRISGTTVSAVATANGASSSSAQTGLATGAWRFVIARFDSDSSRRVRISTGNWSSESTTTRSAADFSTVSIGSHHASGVTGSFNGRIVGATILRGVNADLIELIADQMAAGLPGSHLWHSADETYLFQRLFTAANESAPIASQSSIGPTLTATSLTFDTDRPIYLPHGGSVDFSSLNDGIAPGIGRFRWLETTGDVVPPHRVVVVDSDGKISLASASDANWIGGTRQGSILEPGQHVTLRGTGRCLLLDAAGGASWTIGSSIAYVAADGKADDEGTNPIGLVIDEPSAGQVRVLTY